LDQENPSLTRRQYKILKNHIATQKAKGATETKSHDNKIKNEGDQRILNATLQESILTSLTPVKIKGKTRYIGSIDLPSWEDLNDRFEKIKAVGMSDIAPTSATFSGIPNQPSHTWPRNKPPSQNLLDFTGNYINREVNRLRSIAEWP